MTLLLHEHCRTRLIQTLSSALSELRVEHGKYIARFDALAALEPAEKVLPGKGELHTQLGRYIDYDRPLTEFILDTLSEELSQLPFTDVETQPLTEVAGYADREAVAQRLLDLLTNLPSKYTLSFQLPSELSPILDDHLRVALSPRLRIVRAGEDLSALYPPTKVDGPEPGALSGLLGALGTGWLSSVNWTKDGVYLQVDAEGYIGPYGGSNPHLEAVRALRAFCGLGLALGLFDTSSAYLSQSPPSDVLIHRQEPNGAFVPIRAITLDDGTSRTIKRLAPSEFLASLESDTRRSAFTKGALVLMQIVLSGGKKADLIFLAAQWFFDGHSHGPDQLLKFIQTMVVLEILLGDKASSDQTGLNVLLRNRCAYLIGNSQEDRAELLEWFRKIYDVRSEIVHSGKHWLSASEFELFVRLRWICRRVIRKEIDLLKANEGNR
jgi:hypothetical protein